MTNALATIKTGALRTVTRTGLKLKKYSPEILVGAGVVSIVSGVVLCCRATLKANDVLDRHEEEMNTIDEAIETGSENYTEQDIHCDKALVYIHTVERFTKIYAPGVALTTLGIGCMLGSYGILKKRNVALMAAYDALQTTFTEYRNRVKEKLGEEEERRIYHGVEKDRENDEGEKLPALPNGYHPSVYSRFFDESSDQWVKNAELNKLNLLKFQDWANDMLRARGHLFLNEVYDMLGLPRSKAGAVVGWLLHGGKDGYVDFGIFNVNRPKARDFVNGYERSILLDFNVDGVIWDKI